MSASRESTPGARPLPTSRGSAAFPVARDDADRHLRLAELRGLNGQSDGAGHRQLAAAAQGEAVDGRDDRFAEVLHIQCVRRCPSSCLGFGLGPVVFTTAISAMSAPCCNASSPARRSTSRKRTPASSRASLKAWVGSAIGALLRVMSTEPVDCHVRDRPPFVQNVLVYRCCFCGTRSRVFFAKLEKMRNSTDPGSRRGGPHMRRAKRWRCRGRVPSLAGRVLAVEPATAAGHITYLHSLPPLAR